MAAQILSDVVNGTISWTEFVTWVTSEDTALNGGAMQRYNSRRGDFVLYFLNFLRDDASRILQATNIGNNSAKKQIPPAQNRVNDGGSNDKANGSRRVELFPSLHGRSTSSDDQGRRADVSSTSVNWDSSRSLVSNDRLQILSTTSESNTQNNACSRLVLNASSSKKKAPLMPSDSNSEEMSLLSCPVSPIVNDSSVYQRSYNADSRTNRVYNKSGSNFNLEDYVVKDHKKPNSSKKRASLHKQTSSPVNSSFSVLDHTASPVMQNESGKTNKTQKRRIKPTRLIGSGNAKLLDSSTAPSFGLISRPVELSTPFGQQTEYVNHTDFRDLLLRERFKQQQPQQSVPQGGAASFSSTPVALHIVPDVGSVSSPEQLTVLVNVYCCLLDSNLIANVATELCFIFSLLLVRTSDHLEQSASFDWDNSMCGNSVYLKSVHECVYFATSVLDHQRYLLNVLDKVSLKLLIESVQIVNFVPDLWKYLCSLYEMSVVNKGNNCVFSTKAFSANVWFQSDTDNRENFPTDQTFHMFRKQRDGFYELLQIWEANHSSPGWTFCIALGARVRSLLNLHNDPANFIHFARLFRSQLRGACQGNINILEDEGLDSDTEMVLKGLKEGNPEKFSRLYERLVAPSKSRGPYSTPSFPGHQEFYRDFIVQGMHSVFNQHLIDSLLHEILAINATNFTASEVEERATSVDEDTRQAFLTCVSTTQLFAKFLGFVVFLPYRTNNKPSERIIETQSAVRTEIFPQIDVLSFLREAAHMKKLVLTIPWIVQFLAMADSVTIRLPYYSRVLELLFNVYHSLSTTNTSFSLFGRLLLKLSLGWLFELSHFPEGLYYTWCSDQERTGGSGNKPMAESCVPSAIDGLEVVDKQCLNLCCPFLGELKLLLASDPSSGSAGSARHITPVPASFDQVHSSATKQLELQLEESFLHGQPGSTRKTVEFVAERVASSCVKLICNSKLPKIKESGLTRIQLLVDADTEKSLVMSRAKTEATQCFLDLRTCCQEMVPAFCEQKCTTVIPALLSEDVSKAVAQLCIEIASRCSQEKINAWVHSHITPGLFSKDFQSEIERSFRNAAKSDVVKISHVLPPGGRNVKHNEDTITPPRAIIGLRELILKVMGAHHAAAVSAEDVLTVLHAIKETARNRCDVIPSAERVLKSLVVDLALALVTHRPVLMTHQMIKEFIAVWKTPELAMCDPSMEILARLMCSRNMFLLSQSKQPSKTWSCLVQLLRHLLCDGLLTVDQLEDQCVALLQLNWPMDTLRNLSRCFEAVVHQYRLDNNGSCDQFVLLLELLSQLCLDMENFESR